MGVDTGAVPLVSARHSCVAAVREAEVSAVAVVCVGRLTVMSSLAISGGACIAI